MSPCHQPAKFLLLIHHGESFRKFPNREYREGKTDMFDFVDIDYFSVDEMDVMVLQLGGLKPKKCSGEADLSKDKSGPEPPPEFQRSWTTVLGMTPETKAKLKEFRTPLVGFSGEVSYPIGTVTLSVTMGEPERLRTIPMEFVVVKSHSSYNVILGRTGLRNLGVVASTIHLMIKFPTANGIATMTTKKKNLQECRRMEEARGPTREGRITFPQTQTCDSKGTTNGGRGRRTRLRSLTAPYNCRPSHLKRMLKQMKKVGGKGNLSAECKAELVEILHKHADASAWTPADMTGIPCFVVEHELKTYPHIEPRV
ncbi:hypothetical protein Tco_0904630 [Tanacetum coccineum]